jgi:hypothetical protein
MASGQELLRFLDHQVFDPILRSRPNNYDRRISESGR